VAAVVWIYRGSTIFKGHRLYIRCPASVPVVWSPGPVYDSYPGK